MTSSKIVRWVALVATATAGMGMVGCGAAGSPPLISDPAASCYYDPTYDTYGWDFSALVDDPDGYTDVTAVSVDVYDVGGATALETWNLAYDGNGQWSNTIYQYNGSGSPSDYSQVLDCENMTAFEFDFRAQDTQGLTDALTYSFQ